MRRDFLGRVERRCFGGDEAVLGMQPGRAMSVNVAVRERPGAPLCLVSAHTLPTQEARWSPVMRPTREEQTTVQRPTETGPDRNRPKKRLHGVNEIA